MTAGRIVAGFLLPGLPARPVRSAEDHVMQTGRLLLWTALLAAAFLLPPPSAPADEPRVRFLRQTEWMERGEWIKADTHIHTRFSDGRHTVSEVAAQAAARGCGVIAITDHADWNLRAATPEYAEAIEVARRQHPRLLIIAGLEWNVPPDGGDTHATLLLPSDSNEWLRLAEFKAKFDDYERGEPDPGLADAALDWLAGIADQSDVPPVLLLNHPSRKLRSSLELTGRFQEWRSRNDLMIGLSGAPGHQAEKPVGAYSKAEPTIDRWDPAVARVGDAWDQLLQRGVDLWGARAPSDFHEAQGHRLHDYWPGEFSETWLYVPERTVDGVLRAFRAGSFFAAHGHIIREAELTVSAAGLPRPAYPGEEVLAPPGTKITVAVSGMVPDTDWAGDLNRLDTIELIGITKTGASVIAAAAPLPVGPLLVEEIEVPSGGLVVRARGRRIVPDGPDLLFYTNPVRISTPTAGAAGPAAGPRAAEDRGWGAARHTTAEPPAGPTTGWGLWPGLLWALAGLLAGLGLRMRVFRASGQRFIQLLREQFRKVNRRPHTSGPDLQSAVLPHLWTPHPALTRVLATGYVFLVTSTALTLAVLAFSAEPVASRSAFGWIPAGWTPGAAAILVWTTGILALTAAPWWPAVCLSVYCALMYGFSRYSPELEYMLSNWFAEWICMLSLLGCLLHIYRQGRWPAAPPRPLLCLMLALTVWALISGALAAAAGSYVRTEELLKHHPGKFVNALIMFLLAAWFLSARRQFQLFVLIVGVTVTVRAFAFPERIYRNGDLAQLAAIVLPLSVAAVRATADWKLKGCFVVIMLNLLRLMYETQSRGAAVAAVSILICLFLFSRHKVRFLAAGIPLLTGGAFLFTATGYWERIETTWQDGQFEGSAQARLDIWTALWSVSRENWGFGVGPGRSADLIGEYFPALAGYAPHSNYLAVLAELGLVGLVLYLSLYAGTLRLVWRTGRSLDRHWPGPEARAACTALVAWGAAGCFITRHDLALAYMLMGTGSLLGVRAAATRAFVLVPESARPHAAPAPPETHAARSFAPVSGNSAAAPRAVHYTVVAAFFLVLAIYGSLVPLQYRPLEFSEAVERFRRIPMYSLGIGSRADWVANILLFIPIGFFSMGALRVDKRSFAGDAASVPFVILSCGMLSVLIEFTQLWFPPRTVSLNDIVAESIGGAAGALLWLVAGNALTQSLRSFLVRRRPVQRVDWLIGAWVLGLAVYSVMPLDLTISLAELNEKFRHGKIELVPFSYPHATPAAAVYHYLSAVLVFIPAGVWFARAWCPPAIPVRSCGATLGLGLLYVTGIELSQLLVWSRYTSATDLITGTAGITFGRLAARHWFRNSESGRAPDRLSSPTGVMQLIAAAGVYTTFLMVLFWYPLDFTADKELIRTRADLFFAVPFARLYYGTEMNALVQILRKSLWFTPLGVLMGFAVCRLPDPAARRLVTVASAIGVFVIATGIEAGQILLPHKTADITDALLCFAGGLAGLIGTLWVVRTVRCSERRRVRIRRAE